MLKVTVMAAFGGTAFAPLVPLGNAAPFIGATASGCVTPGSPLAMAALKGEKILTPPGVIVNGLLILIPVCWSMSVEGSVSPQTPTK